MTDAELIQALGGASKVAAALGVSRQRVVNWTLSGREISGGMRAAVLALARRQNVAVNEAAFLRLPAGLVPAA